MTEQKFTEEFLKSLSKSVIQKCDFIYNEEKIHILDYMVEGAYETWWLEILTKPGAIRVHPSKVTYIMKAK